MWKILRSQVPGSSSFAWFWQLRMVLAWQTDEVKSNNPTHIHRQARKPTSQSKTTVLAMATVRVKNESHSPKLSQNHSPSQSQSQRPGHGHRHSLSQIHATIQEHFELNQMGNTFALVNLPFLLIITTAGHGHSHSPSHSLS